MGMPRRCISRAKSNLGQCPPRLRSSITDVGGVPARSARAWPSLEQGPTTSAPAFASAAAVSDAIKKLSSTSNILCPLRSVACCTDCPLSACRLISALLVRRRSKLASDKGRPAVFRTASATRPKPTSALKNMGTSARRPQCGSICLDISYRLVAAAGAPVAARRRDATGRACEMGTGARRVA